MCLNFSSFFCQKIKVKEENRNEKVDLMLSDFSLAFMRYEEEQEQEVRVSE